MFDSIHWLEWALGALMTILGWFHKSLYAEHRELQKEVNELKVITATRVEIEKLRLELKDDINRGFERLYDRLDKLQEKE